MKLTILFFLVFVSSLHAQTVVAPQEISKEDLITETRKKKAASMTERLTSAELAQRKAAAVSTMANTKFKPVEDKPSHVIEKHDLYRDSEIITDGSSHTTLPRGCILGYSEALANRVVEKAHGVFLFWPEFYQKNKSWIKLQEVDVATAKGEVPLSESLIKNLQVEEKLSVAVYKGNPVSVLEFKAEEKVEPVKK